ncbi:glycan-binding surface protein [Desertivirga xinjiangensis]|uniref:glycan-binding surface protein n=1 Tax=Desertivirga xinjiangensis TaxID=539206 RepID=UPI00210C5F1F|nr:glycan-binding surface protein [Pedobacter xinjiangensis]
MKNFYTALSFRAIVLNTFLCLVFLFAACDKEEAGPSGPPIIEGVSLVDEAKADSSFVQALPGTFVTINGRNLLNTEKVYFNDFNAPFNPTLNTNTHLIVMIPAGTPTPVTDPNVPNKLRLVTPKGEVSFDFSIVPPPPVISAVVNENTIPGQEMTITGANLLSVSQVIFPGERQVTPSFKNAAGTILKVIMPADLGVTESGKVRLISAYGNAQWSGEINKFTGTGVISNLEQPSEVSWGVYNWQATGAVRKNDQALFPGNTGYYLQSTFSAAANNTAYSTGSRAGTFTLPGQSLLADLAHRDLPADTYALKFEVNTKVGWDAATMILKLGTLYSHRFKPYLTAEGQVFHTNNSWQTVTVPLNQFRLTANNSSGTGAQAVKVGDIINAEGKVQCIYWLVTESKAVAAFDAAFDNFRIVKIK